MIHAYNEFYLNDAKLSGVSLRSIQMYEQKVNDIDKA